MTTYFLVIKLGGGLNDGSIARARGSDSCNALALPRCKRTHERGKKRRSRDRVPALAAGLLQASCGERDVHVHRYVITPPLPYPGRQQLRARAETLWRSLRSLHWKKLWKTEGFVALLPYMSFYNPRGISRSPFFCDFAKKLLKLEVLYFMFQSLYIYRRPEAN
jgi:hypothetical protein